MFSETLNKARMAEAKVDAWPWPSWPWPAPGHVYVHDDSLPAAKDTLTNCQSAMSLYRKLTALLAKYPDLTDSASKSTIENKALELQTKATALKNAIDIAEREKGEREARKTAQNQRRIANQQSQWANDVGKQANGAAQSAYGQSNQPANRTQSR